MSNELYTLKGGRSGDGAGQLPEPGRSTNLTSIRCHVPSEIHPYHIPYMPLTTNPGQIQIKQILRGLLFRMYWTGLCDVDTSIMSGVFKVDE